MGELRGPLGNGAKPREEPPPLGTGGARKARAREKRTLRGRDGCGEVSLGRSYYPHACGGRSYAHPLQRVFLSGGGGGGGWETFAEEM